MNLFTQEDKDFSQRVQKSDWSPTPPVVEQLREDFYHKNPTTEQLENHEDWEIVERRPTSVSHSDGSRTEDAEILEVKYCGDESFETEVVPSEILPNEYVK